MPVPPFRRFAITLIAAGALALCAGGAAAQDTIKVADIQELSGTGATAGTNFKNGVELAIKEINASGGILGKKIESAVSDTQSNPGVAKAMATKAVDNGVIAVFGPNFSGSMIVSMGETRKGETPNFTGAEATAITAQGNPFVIRTSFSQINAMPKLAKYVAANLKAQSIAVIFVNNDFGKGGRDAFIKSAEANGIKIAADISTEPGQVDWSSPVLKAKQSNADAVFVYTNEEESARALRELRKQGWNKPIIGETVLPSQKVIELAGEASNGALAHVGLTVDAPIPTMRAFRAKFEKAYNYIPDHNGIKGYTSVYMFKAGVEKAGKIDRIAINKALHGLTITVAKEPGILMDVSIDEKGDLDRESFIVEVRNGKQEVKEVLPALGKKP